MRITLIVGALVSAAALAASCGSSGVCAPGQQIACACPGGAQGAQACNADGKGFGACLCNGGSSSSSSSSGGTGGMAASSSSGSTGGMGTTSSSSGMGGSGTTSSSSSTSSSTGGVCAPAWSKGFAPSNQMSVSQVAVDAMGNVVVAGSLLGQVDLGTGPVFAGSTQAGLFVAKYDCTGTPIWSKGLGVPQTSGDQVLGMALSPAGDIVLAGQFGDVLDFGCGQLFAQGVEGFVAKLDAGGNCVWSKHFGGVQSANACTGVAVDGTGNVVVTGSFVGWADFGGGYVNSGTSSALFALQLGPTGSFSWVKQFGHPGVAGKVAVDAAANLFLCGSTGAGSLDFGGGPITGGDALYVAKLSQSGGFVWSKGFTGTAACNAAVTDTTGNLVLGGTYASTLDLGGGPLPVATGITKLGGFVAKLTPAGALGFAVGNGGKDATTSVNGVGVDAAGKVFFAGHFSAGLGFGSPGLTSAGGFDAFFVGLSPTGGFLSAQRFGDAADQIGSAIALTPSGAPVLGGTYQGTITFGTALPQATGNGSAFLARL